MSRIKLGLVGIGKIARDQHLPVLQENDAFELVACASRKGRVEGLANYTSLPEVLDAEPTLEAVSLCTPPAPREADARLALSRGLHVLLEKPPATTLSAARDLAARATGSVLCASWHSRHAPAVAAAKHWLQDKRILHGEIQWREDIRRWHPGQDWILEAGGMGVFDPGINALSILTEILAAGVFLSDAELHTPSNRQSPIAASLSLQTKDGAPISVEFDFLQTGPQRWDIRLETNAGELTLQDGGARLTIGNTQQDTPPPDKYAEYRGVYAHFAECIRRRRSDVDLRPLELVADAFMRGVRHPAPPFAF